jgi:hypothetical protein
MEMSGDLSATNQTGNFTEISWNDTKLTRWEAERTQMETIFFNGAFIRLV